MTTTINFYNVGLNATNLPYNAVALADILQAGQIEDGGQVFALTLTALPFDQFFNITNETYQIIKSATYLKLTNTFTDSQNVQHIETRYAFVDKIQQLANGNYSVFYTVDNWTSFYINSGLYELHIDGFTERANVPLLQNGKFRSNNIPLTAGTGENGLKAIHGKKPTRPTGHGIALPTGYICAVYFISTPKYKGDPSDAIAHGTVLDYDNYNNAFRTIPRNNSNIYYMVFDNNGYNVGIYGKNSQNDAYTEIVPAGNIQIFEPDDSTIEKIMYFDFIPSDDTVRWSYGFQQLNYNGVTVWGIAISGTTDNNLKIRLADIYHGNDNRYYMAEYLTSFAPVMEISLSQYSDLLFQNSSFSTTNNYNNYIRTSLYRNIDEFREITIKCLSAEIKTSIANLYSTSKIIIEFSGDGETIVIKLANTNLLATLRSNTISATGQNTAYFDLVQVRDFKAYKNAKITGAAGLAASALGSVTALGASIATGNVAGVVGSLSGGAQGVISGVQRLQGLTPAQQSPASGDKTLTDMLNDFDFGVYIVENLPLYDLRTSKAKYLEENGALIEIAFADYYTAGYQMQAYNALKMRSCDVTGAPSEICDDIKNKLLTGVTLWTANDVGNKAVINYKKEN